MKWQKTNKNTGDYVNIMCINFYLVNYFTKICTTK